MSDSTNIPVPHAEFPDDEQIGDRIERLREVDRPRYERLWAYCQNPMRVTGRPEGTQDRPYRQAQEWGLPARITGARGGLDIFQADEIDEVARKEVVIENDIGWRIETMVILLADSGNIRKQKKPKEKPKKRRPKPYRLKPSPRPIQWLQQV